MSPVRQPEATRAKILETALELFHTRTFNGTSLNEIVEKAGITKGALFHHFKGKVDLCYEVIDGPLRAQINETWVQPLSVSIDPISDILLIIAKLSDQACEDPTDLSEGCPLNNLSQELASQDEGFREKLIIVYNDWQNAMEKAFRAGIDAGNVSADVDPKTAAVSIIAFCEGAIGTLKVHQSMDHLSCLGHGLSMFLKSMRFTPALACFLIPAVSLLSWSLHVA